MLKQFMFMFLVFFLFISFSLADENQNCNLEMNELYQSYLNGFRFRYPSIIQNHPLEKDSWWGGTFAWFDSYLMESYNEVYRATKNTSYLDALVKHADFVISKRDDKFSIKDYTGKVHFGWSSTKYTQGQYYRWIVHQGNILYPMLDFAKIVYDDKSLHQKYKSKADYYLQEAKKVVSEHESEWVSDGNGGYYSDREGNPLPHNHGAAIGRTLILLYDLTKDTYYLNKVKRIATNFKKDLTLKDGAYLWPYNQGRSINDGGEDIEHGSLSVSFPYLAYRHGIIFTETDMKRFAKTFTDKIFISGSKLASYIGGTSLNSKTGSYNDIGFGWAQLVYFDERIYSMGMSTIDLDNIYGNLLSTSVLLRYQQEKYSCKHEKKEDIPSQQQVADNPPFSLVSKAVFKQKIISEIRNYFSGSSILTKYEIIDAISFYFDYNSDQWESKKGKKTGENISVIYKKVLSS